MKKIALTSLLAVFAVSGAMAANVIDGNPLYVPKAGHFYSETSLETHTNNVDAVVLAEEFGYGITDRLSVSVATDFDQEDWFETAGWDSVELGLTYRIADYTNWKFDVLGGYGVGPVWDAHNGFMKGRFLSKGQTNYAWLAGVRGGYTTGDFTIAGHAAMIYDNTESFNWNKGSTSTHDLIAGVDGQLVLNSNWNLVAGAEYSTTYEDYSKRRGMWDLTFGANYNFDETKYAGAYITKTIDHTSAVADGTWEVEDGFGMGVKFGIDF